MVNICDLIKQLKDLYDSKEKITFKLPAYEVFHERLTTFIYENHFEKTKEWEIISGNLLYKSSQYMIRSEADNILLNLLLAATLFFYGILFQYHLTYYLIQ